MASLGPNTHETQAGTLDAHFGIRLRKGCARRVGAAFFIVIPGLVPGIHVRELA
jgi:hypothetical protein